MVCEYSVAELFPHTRSNYYPNRPKLSFISGLSLIGLSYSGALSYAAYFGSSIITDDLLLYSIQRLRKYIHNISRGLKPLKSWVELFSTLSGYLLGGLAAHHLLASIPLIKFFFTTIISAMHCNFMVLVATQSLGIMLANMMHRPAYEGVIGALFVSALIPIVLPIAVDIYGLSILIGGFMGSYFSKVTMRTLYKWCYGHPGIDVYRDVNDDEDPVEIDEQVSDVLNVDPKLVQRVRLSILTTITHVRQQTSTIGKLIGADKACVQSLKSVLEVLLTVKDERDKRKLCFLLSLTLDVNKATNTGLTEYESHYLRKKEHRFERRDPEDGNKLKPYLDSSYGLAVVKMTKVFNPFASCKPNQLEANVSLHRHGWFSSIAKSALANKVESIDDIDLQQDCLALRNAIRPNR